MWTTLALAAALTVTTGQSGKLELVNVRPTYGSLGPARPDNKVLPLDVYWLAFDMVGLKPDANGDLVYGLALEVSDSKGKVVFKQEDDDKNVKKVPNPFGAGRLPVTSILEIGRDLPTGKYTVKITASDKVAKSSDSTTQTFEVQPAAFGLVRVDASYDVNGQVPAPLVGSPGQTVFLNALVVGFDRDAKKNPNLTLSLRVLEGGKPLSTKPLSFDVDALDERVKELPAQFRLDYTRAGTFTIEVTAEDKVSKKKAVVTMPLTVIHTVEKPK
jgi:hypothetical protein